MKDKQRIALNNFLASWRPFLPREAIVQGFVIKRNNAQLPEIEPKMNVDPIFAFAGSLWKGQGPANPNLAVLSIEELDSESVSLLGKMLDSINLDHGDVFVGQAIDVSLKNSNDLIPGAILFLGKGSLPSCSSIPFFQTHHPSQLIKNPELKKETWQTLKKLVREIQ